MIIHTRYGFLLLVVLLAACASPGHFTPTPISTQGNSMVYLYRPAASNPGAKPLYLSYPEVMIDGNSHGLLQYDHYLAIELAPGRHQFRLTGLTENARWEPKDVTHTIDLKPGEVAFLKFRVEYNTAEMGLLDMGPKYIISLNQLPESTAVYEIRDTRKAGS
jgi:hypothetical protein